MISLMVIESQFKLRNSGTTISDISLLPVSVSPRMILDRASLLLRNLIEK